MGRECVRCPPADSSVLYRLPMRDEDGTSAEFSKVSSAVSGRRAAFLRQGGGSNWHEADLVLAGGKKNLIRGRSILKSGRGFGNSQAPTSTSRSDRSR